MLEDRQIIDLYWQRDGNVFVRRCFFAEPIAAIAKRYELCDGHVSVILNRTRKKLRAYLMKEYCRQLRMWQRNSQKR